MRTVSTCSLVFFPISTMQGMLSKRPLRIVLVLFMGSRGGAVSVLKPFAINESAKAVAVLLSEIPQNVRC